MNYFEIWRNENPEEWNILEKKINETMSFIGNLNEKKIFAKISNNDSTKLF